MMTYKDLQKDFKKALNKEIARYERRYKDKKMPKHRSQDIATLKSELAKEIDDTEALKTNIQSILANIKTGFKFFNWWILQTGNSKLRDYVNRTLNKDEYSYESFLKARITELEALQKQASQIEPENELLSGEEDQEDRVNANVEVKAKLAELKKQYDEEVSKNKKLQEEINLLRGRNVNLYDKNRALRSRTDSLQNSLEGKGNSETISPSDEISKSFAGSSSLPASNGK